MNSIVYFKFILFALMAGALTCHAQTKIGYADVEYILSQLPETKQIESELKSTESQLSNQINSKTEELKKKYENFVSNEKNMLEAVRVSAQHELELLNGNLEKLKQDTQLAYQNKHTQLLEPVYKKMGTAIESVAKENGFTFILNPRIGGQDVIIYADEKMDISVLVLKQLGVAPPPSTK